jgi:hypothetical protein
MKGASDVARLLSRYPEKVGRTLESLVKQEARGLAVELSRNTRPFGFSEAAKKRGEKAVAGDIGKVFALPSDAFEKTKLADPAAANLFWANIQNRRFARAEKVLQSSYSQWKELSVGRLDPKLHKANRTGPNANVTRKQSALIFCGGLTPADFQVAFQRLEEQSRELEAAQVETMGDIGGKKPLPATNPAS